MSGFELGQFAYLALLGAVIAFWFFVQNRHQMGRVLQQAAIWALIFLGLIAVFGLWGEIRQQTVGARAMMTEGGRVEVPRAPDGHYYLTLRLNGTPVSFVVDTGATDLVLSVEDAERAGIDHAGLRFDGIARTANGTVSTARVRLDEVRLGEIVDRDVPARVSGGEMPGSLLGMGYLSRFSSLTIEDGMLTLTR